MADSGKLWHTNRDGEHRMERWITLLMDHPSHRLRTQDNPTLGEASGRTSKGESLSLSTSQRQQAWLPAAAVHKARETKAQATRTNLYGLWNSTDFAGILEVSSCQKQEWRSPRKDCSDAPCSGEHCCIGWESVGFLIPLHGKLLRTCLSFLLRPLRSLPPL